MCHGQISCLSLVCVFHLLATRIDHLIKISVLFFLESNIGSNIGDSEGAYQWNGMEPDQPGKGATRDDVIVETN